MQGGRLALDAGAGGQAEAEWKARTAEREALVINGQAFLKGHGGPGTPEVEIVPIEVTIRNIVAGGIAKLLGLETGDIKIRLRKSYV